MVVPVSPGCHATLSMLGVRSHRISPVGHTNVLALLLAYAVLGHLAHAGKSCITAARVGWAVKPQRLRVAS